MNGTIAGLDIVPYFGFVGSRNGANEINDRRNYQYGAGEQKSQEAAAHFEQRTADCAKSIGTPQTGGQ